MSSPSAAKAGFAQRRAAVERRRRSARLWRGRALLAAAFGAIAGLLAALPHAEEIHRAGIDVLLVGRHRVWGPMFPAERSEVAVVVIDEETYQTPPFSGRPRVAWSPYVAKVIEAIDAAGPKVIGYDYVDPTSLDQPDLLRGYDRPLLRAISKSGREGRLVLGEIRLSRQKIEPYRGQRIAVGGDDNVRLLNVLVDDDEVVRRQPLGFATEDSDEFRLAFATELARRAGARLPQTDFLINFNTGPNDIPDYSFADLLACAEGEKREFFERAFKDKVVLIGPSLDVEDRRYSSTWLIRQRPELERQARCALPADTERFGAIVDRRTVPGVFLHAAAINTLLKDIHLHLTPPAITFAAVALAGFVGAIIFFALSPALGMVAGFGLLVVEGGASLLAFRAGWVAPVTALWITATAGFALVYAYRFVVEDRDKRRIATAFKAYLAPEMVERLSDDPDALKLGGEGRRVAIMFSDIVGYTTLSEKLGKTPERLVEIINRYLTVACGTIERHGGYVDKFIGDAVMAMWNAPLDDAEADRHAVETALDLIAGLEAFNRDVVVGEYGLPPIGTRVGVNSGLAIVGNMGTSSRMNYTVTGDVVNLASRIEGANKTYGSLIMIGEETARGLGSGFVLRLLDRLIVKGKSKPVEVFEVIGRAGAVAPEVMARVAAFSDALDLYYRRDFAAARDAFAAIGDADAAAVLYAGRAAEYLAEPPPPDWDGSYTMKTK